MSNDIPPPGYGVAGVEYDPHGATVTGAGVYNDPNYTGYDEESSYEEVVGSNYAGQEIVGTSSSEWSIAAKLAVVVGGAVAIYLIFRMSEGAKPVAKKLGGMAEKILSARVGNMFDGLGSNASTPRGLAPKRVKMYATPLSARMVKT